MDNVTHTLIGVSLAHAVARSESDDDRLLLIWASGLASNLADFDFLVPILAGDNGKIGYLLQHRGYSHTAVMMPLIAALAVGISLKVTRVRPRSWMKLGAIALLAAALHLVADSWNDYGVHPFWPFNNDWFYGDSIFIIEPTFLLAMLPFAVAATRAIWVRYFWAALSALLLTLIWFGPFIQWQVALGLTLWFAAFSWPQWSKPRPEVALGGVALSLAIFFTGSMLTRADIRSQLEKQAASERIVELARSPSPANPFCWRLMTVTLGPNGEYIARMGAYSAWPAVFDPKGCNQRIQAERTARLSPPTIDSTSRLIWLGEFRGEVAELKNLAGQSCQLAAMLHYLRIAYWQRQGTHYPAGDLRYDFQRELGFAELDLNDPGKCPKWVPNWTPPLHAVLDK